MVSLSNHEAEPSPPPQNPPNFLSTFARNRARFSGVEKSIRGKMVENGDSLLIRHGTRW
jgi:hypothetical protein